MIPFHAESAKEPVGWYDIKYLFMRTFFYENILSTRSILGQSCFNENSGNSFNVKPEWLNRAEGFRSNIISSVEEQQMCLSVQKDL